MPGLRPPTTTSAVLVGYREHAREVAAAVDSLRAQTVPPEEIVYVDQRSDVAHRAAVRAIDDAVRVVEIGRNVGYVEACRAAVEHAAGSRVLFLNVDARAAPDCLMHLHRALDERPTAALAGAQVLLPGGRTVNAGDNPVHPTGLAWSGRYGEAPERGVPRAVASVSGAALLVGRDAFVALGGFTAGFFMYYDDVDFAWRARMLGREVLFVPEATIEHDYAFEKGGYKWRWLERNRWWCVLAHYERRTLLLLAPLLLATELAILLGAARGGWLRPKLTAWRSLWRARRALVDRRREIQRTRHVDDGEILRLMRPTLDSPMFPRAPARAAAPGLRAYVAGVRALVRSRG